MSAYEPFGANDPRQMPLHFFGCFGHGGVGLDYESAVKADIARQNYTVAPRHWYIDATMRCADCDEMFVFSAAEQRAWYEEYGFYVDSRPRRCPKCRGERRRLKTLRQEYDRDIASALAGKGAELKSRMIEVIDQLCESLADLPAKIHENRKQLASQVARFQQ